MHCWLEKRLSGGLDDSWSSFNMMRHERPSKAPNLAASEQLSTLPTPFELTKAYKWFDKRGHRCNRNFITPALNDETQKETSELFKMCCINVAMRTIDLVVWSMMIQMLL